VLGSQLSIFLLLFPFAYFVFVFFSECFNPFVKTKLPMKRDKWRLGRMAAIVTIFAGLTTLLAISMFSLSPVLAIGMFSCLGALLFFPSLLKYKKSQAWD